MSFLTKPPYDQPLRCVIPVPRELTPAEARRVHVLHLRRDSLLKSLAFVEAKLARELSALAPLP